MSHGQARLPSVNSQTMRAILGKITPTVWVLLAGLFSASMLAFAFYAEHVENYLPCPLCLRQREVYFAVIAVAATGYLLMRIRPTRRFADGLALMIGLIFLTGAVVATYHAGAEFGWWQGPSGCSGGGSGLDVVIDIDSPEGVVSCVDPLWHFLGFSMAAWNAVISVGLALASFAAVRNPFTPAG